jgi:F-type H+-transporting ATPase subunit epsilon
MPLDLSIVTPEGEDFAGTVDGVVFPGVAGDFGVLPGHERFLSPLRCGEVEITSGGRKQWAAISGGFVEVKDDHVTALVETCELASDIDVARAERARERAEQKLKSIRDAAALEGDLKLWEAALQRAVVRIQTAAKRG